MGNNVQRYIFSHAILKDETGGFVRHDDHCAEIARLEEQLAAANAHFQLVQNEFIDRVTKLAAAEAKIERVKSMPIVDGYGHPGNNARYYYASDVLEILETTETQ